METNYNTPAFPINEETTIGQMGMTMLDYFAAKALNGLCANEYDYESYLKLAEKSYMAAAAMLEERKKYIK